MTDHGDQPEGASSTKGGDPIAAGDSGAGAESSSANAPSAATAGAGDGPRPECMAIARRLAHSSARVIGFLPAGRRLPDSLPLITDIAQSLAQFLSGEVGVIPTWSRWTGQAGGAKVQDARRPHVFSVLPPPCPEADLATTALQETVARHAPGFHRLLVDLSRYARPGEVPGAAEHVDGVVILAPMRRIWTRQLKRLTGAISPAKNLGAILIG